MEILHINYSYDRCGYLLGLSIISMTGYALQRKDFPFRNAISFYIYFTSLFQQVWLLIIC